MVWTNSPATKPLPFTIVKPTCNRIKPPTNQNTRVLIKQLNKKEAGLYKSMFKALGKGLKDDQGATAATAAAGEDATAASMEAEGPAAVAAAPEPIATA